MKGFTTIHAGSARQALSRLRFICQLAETSSEIPLAALNALAFERDVSTIRAGDPVELLAPGAASSQVSGRVAYVGDEIEAQSKTAAVRAIVEQPTVPLRPGQLLLAKIHTSAKAEPSVVLPRDAVTSVDGKPTVFVAHDLTSVEPRAIQVGRQDGHQVEVLEGLKTGERVVVSGVFALKSEIFR